MVAVGSTLAHVMVVAGIRRDWAAMDAEAWTARAEELGSVVADAGGAWLTIRAYERGPDADAVVDGALVRRTIIVAGGRCTAVIDPESDGRRRFAEAMRELPAGAVVDEKAVAGALYAPADVEPDLVLVLGPPTRLPPSLVWELAYGELVFDEHDLNSLGAEQIRDAIEEFNGRRRRFGGLDP
jgi:undecaprenyl diphosphate synthase